MPYFTAAHIVAAIAALREVHPFHGITYLACKHAGLPVGTPRQLSVDSLTRDHLRRYHRLAPDSKYFFQPFRTTDKTKNWVAPNYAATGLQSINTQAFHSAFIHEIKGRTWAWSPDYVSVLRSKLYGNQPLPAYELAVWLFRDFEWPKAPSPADVVTKLSVDFVLAPQEFVELFDSSHILDLDVEAENFQDQAVTWLELGRHFSAPPDAKPDEGGILTLLQTKGIGPAREFRIEPAERLTLITGDNGLGKSFLLDAAWWALTGVWASRPAFPLRRDGSEAVEISFSVSGGKGAAMHERIKFDDKMQRWPAPKKRPTIAGLVVYARVDGSFAVWDPARQVSHIEGYRNVPTVLTGAEVWDGVQGKIEGLVRDWVKWQSRPDAGEYATFKRVLSRLSPADLGELKPGDTVRVPDDSRDIPTLIYPYGQVPILYASAGVRRIITLAYLLVWAWREHLVAAHLARTAPQKQMVVLVDELEAHLHPKWQRSFLPALTEIDAYLEPELKAQFIVATHSPLVMASSESIFDVDSDKLFHLDMNSSGEISLKELDFIRYGDVSAWLMSPVFNLLHARSQEAELAIEDAKRLQMQSTVSAADVRTAHSRLKATLGVNDYFWPRWVSFAERNGVDL